MSNVGSLDRVVRVIVGLALIAAPLIAGWPMPWLVASIVVGAVLMVTSAISFCPIYALLGLSSKQRQRS